MIAMRTNSPTKLPMPCSGVKRSECRYTEDEYVTHNKGAVREWGEARIREDHRRHIRVGIIPPRCTKCGWHHWSEENPEPKTVGQS